MIDEYDTIHELLRPFWGIPPATIRQNIRDTLSSEDNVLPSLFIRNGKIIKPKYDWGTYSKDRGNWYTDIVSEMIQKFANHLPDMELLVNLLDEPAVLIPHDILDQLVKTAQNFQQHQKPRNSFSNHPFDDLQSHYGANFLKLGCLMTWNQITLSCPPNSPARQTNGIDLITSYARGPLGFIYNKTAFSNVCNQPSLPYHHGFFDSPHSLNFHSIMLPIFSQSKVSTFNDMLLPSLVVYDGRMGLDESRDMDWELKQDQLHWRGSTTGGFTTIGGLRRHHRHRFVAAMNNITSPVNILKKVRNGWVEDVMSPAIAQTLVDVKFSNVVKEISTPEAFEAQFKEFDLAPHEDQQDIWKWKYLLDIDGNGLSGRYSALLKSKSLVFKCAMFREWHDEWLWPWVHYVPLGLNGSDWFETVRFFAQEETGQYLGERMAHESRQWANSVLRKEDVEAWMFRLLLEYVFTISPLTVDMVESSMISVRLSDFICN